MPKFLRLHLGQRFRLKGSLIHRLLAQPLGLLALVNCHPRSYAQLEVSQGQGHLCQATSPALPRHTGSKGGPERKGFNSLIDLRDVEG